MDYTLNYSIFRSLTHDEIKQLYDKDYKQLSKFEFYELFSNEPDQARREEYQRRALEVYPSFLAAANDLQVSLLGHGMSDETLLEKFVGEDAPQEVNTNQLIALLNAGHFSKADSVAASSTRTRTTASCSPSTTCSTDAMTTTRRWLPRASATNAVCSLP